METASMSSDIPKPSFAKVAAATSVKDKAPVTTSVRRVSGQDQSDKPAASAPMAPVTPHMPTIANGSSTAYHGGHTAVSPAPPPKAEAVDGILDGFKDMRMGTKAPSLVVNGSASGLVDRSKLLTRDGSDDSQRADSNSELGTKPPSLDGKSITSGTTFALDEKESLRPDDSASVKATAGEDDDSFSFRGPLLPNSRMGSDLAARARGIQLGDMPDRRPPLITSSSMSQGVATPQTESSDQQLASTKAKITDLSNYMNALHGQSPDDKLLEAMTSPKDRLFVLRLEADLIKFVTKSKEPFMDFPPCNSFCRMLTHKLADYYHMTHQFEPRIQSVRIFRTPYARVPESLATLGIPEPKSEAPPPSVVLPRKIMRRGEDGAGGSGSGTPSKAASEIGADGKDKSAAGNQKMTREEREEAYNKARERIFGSSDKTGESTPDQEGENGISRASSVSAKDKANGAKRGKNIKQRRDDSDSLDSRHLYGPFGPQQSWATQPQYGAVGNPQYPMPMQQQPPYGPQMQQMQQQMYPPPGQPYQPPMHPGYAYGAPMPGQYQGPPQHPPQPPQPPQQRPPAGPSGGMYGSPVPPAPQPAWQPGFSPNLAPAPMPGTSPSGPPFAPRNMANPSAQSTVQYAYGQLPANGNPNDPKSQHPIPGSYNRHAFNPKTQSFVPGGAMGALPQPQPPFSAPGSHHGSPQVGSPHLAYNGYQQPGPPAGFSGPAGYGMARQGSSSSVPPYQSPGVQHVQQMPPMPQPPVANYMPAQMPQGLPQNPHAHIPNKPAPPQGPAGQFGHLPQYGNPATLPQKPNTGI